MQLFDGQRQQGCFRNTGNTDVDIQNVGACLDLLDSLSEDVIKVLGQDSLLHLRLAGGVDALADDPHPVDGNKGGGSTHAGNPRQTSRARGRGVMGKHPMDCGKKGRVGAAAAAEQMNAQRKVILQGLREYFRGNMVVAGLRVGQTGIRLQEDGQGGGFLKLAGQRK